MDIVVRVHVILSIGTLTKENTKNQVRLELDMYFNELMRIATSADLAISIDIMHQYVTGLTALKTMMHMLSDGLDWGAKLVY